MSDHSTGRLALRPQQTSRGAIQHRQLLDALAGSVPSDPYPEIETATVTRLQHPVPWDEGGDLVSVLATCHRTLAVRAVGVIAPGWPSARLVGQPPRIRRETRLRYELILPATHLTDLTRWLRQHWVAAARQVSSDRYPERRRAAARTMLRAALLVSSSNRSRTQVRLRVPDVDALRTLASAAKTLGLDTTEHRTQSGHLSLTVDDPAQRIRLLRAVGAGSCAEAWTARG